MPWMYYIYLMVFLYAALDIYYVLATYVYTFTAAGAANVYFCIVSIGGEVVIEYTLILGILLYRAPA